jgi:hypothetical protein
VKKDTHAIKKKLIRTMNPAEEAKKFFKFKPAKQPSVNKKIDDLKQQNDEISNELKKVKHQNKAVKSLLC